MTRSVARILSRAAGFMALLPVFPPGPAPAQEAGPTARIPDVVFVGTPAAVVTGMLDLAGVAEGDLVYDLGSGDGRIVIEAARRGARGVGLELEPSLVEESRARADSAGLGERVEFRRADIFESDLREATVVTLFLGRMLNERLRPILLRDLRPGSRVVSQAFDMGDWRPDSVMTVRAREFAATPVHLWVIPARVAGSWRLTVEGGTTAGERLRLGFLQRYQEVKGTVTIGGRTEPLREVRLRGDSLTFAIGPTRFAGRVTGEAASGTVLSRDGSRGHWRAVRREPP